MLSVALSLILCCSIFAAILFGRIDISAVDALRAVLAKIPIGGPWHVDETTQVVIFDIRLSRVILSVLVGMSLSVAGATFQGILRNPLADPFTIGVATGAAFGASVAIFSGIIMGDNWWAGLGILPLASFAGAALALFSVIVISRVNGQLRRDTMILAGIVVATFLSALISLLKSLDEESVTSIVFWVMGSFQGRGWSHVLFAFPYMVLGLLLVMRYARELDILALGDMQAAQLGVDVTRVRLVLLIGASMLTAAAVSVSGVIGFIGLVMPHLVRIVFGAEHKRLLILAGLLGGIALLWSDVAARTILSGGEELPVGVITALFGGPFFCLLLKQRLKWGSHLD